MHDVDTRTGFLQRQSARVTEQQEERCDRYRYRGCAAILAQMPALSPARQLR
jgi:hypothetical protein